MGLFWQKKISVCAVFFLRQSNKQQTSKSMIETNMLKFSISSASAVLILLTFIINFSSAAIVKRDTYDDIKDSIGDVLGISDEKTLMEEIKSMDIDRTQYCIEDQNCKNVVEFCNKEKYIVYGTCQTQTWVGVIIAVGIGVLCLSCFGGVIICFIKKICCCS